MASDDTMDVSVDLNAALSHLTNEYSTLEDMIKQKLILNQSRVDADKVVLTFALDGRTLSLLCPTAYPHYNNAEDNFFVEVDHGLELWANALNEYLLDTDGRLSLTSVLSKGLSLYSSADASTSSNASAAGACASGGSAAYPSTSSSQRQMTGHGSAWRPRDMRPDSLDEEDDDDDEEEDNFDEDQDMFEERTDEPENSNGYPLSDGLDSDLQWELEIARRRKRWRIKEEELRAERLRAASNSSKNNNPTEPYPEGKEDVSEEDKTLFQLFQDPSLKSRQLKQVFTSAGASGILTNDLVSIMAAADSVGLEADSVDDNIFLWNVKIKNFVPNSPLDVDFRELLQKFGYDYIELQLDFSMDLYPFFPPLLKVIRPRLQGSMMLRVTTIEILKLSFWNPARDMKSVLLEIKKFLQTWARLDLASERNDRFRYSDGGYIDIEHHLLRLALVSEVVSRANNKYVTTVLPQTLPPITSMETESGDALVPAEDNWKKSQSNNKMKFGLFSISAQKHGKEDKKKVASGAKTMAKGTGYSTYQHKGWDVKTYVAAQKEKDKQIELVLDKIHLELKKLNSSVLADGENKSSGKRKNSRRKRKHSPDEGSTADSCSTVDPHSDLYAVLEGSALIPFIEARLRANSFLEICRHSNVYKCIINIIKEIACQPYLLPLLAPISDQPESIQALLLALSNQAKILLDKIGKSSANGSVPKSTKNCTSEKATDDKLAKDFQNLFREVTDALKSQGFVADPLTELVFAKESSPTHSNHNNHTDEEGVSESPIPDDSLSPTEQATVSETSSVELRRSREEKSKELYKKHMRSLQVDTCSFSLSGAHSHGFSSNFQKSAVPSSSLIFRIAQELSSLSTSLPLDLSSAIYLRSDDDKATLLRAIITGPEGTPYSGGCYQFDVFFPLKYPSVAPSVSFRTTGGGVVRFNPNLYQCGKVCLSLLGTWEGASGEHWNETSTLLQVLISIQSLILCAEPYFNEPGYDRLVGTAQGVAESLKYSEIVFKNNMKYAILGQLNNPPEGFEEVVKAHFFLKRHLLIEELEGMLKDYKSKEVRKIFNDVKRELMRLEQPPGLKESYKSPS